MCFVCLLLHFNFSIILNFCLSATTTKSEKSVEHAEVHHHKYPQAKLLDKDKLQRKQWHGWMQKLADTAIVDKENVYHVHLLKLFPQVWLTGDRIWCFKVHCSFHAQSRTFSLWELLSRYSVMFTPVFGVKKTSQSEAVLTLVFVVKGSSQFLIDPMLSVIVLILLMTAQKIIIIIPLLTWNSTYP